MNGRQQPKQLSQRGWIDKQSPLILDFLIDLRLLDICFTRYCCGFKIHGAPVKIASGWRA